MIWVTGSRGMLGQEIVKLLDERGIPHVDTDMDCDITDPSAVRAFVEGKRIDWIVNCSAYTAVDRAEEEEFLAERVNALGPCILGETSARIGARIVHISTDYVFDGEATEPYTEDAPMAPTGAYGRTKAHGEEALRVAAPGHFILRTAWLYGARGKNFVFTMLRLMNERGEVSVVNDQFGTPTYAPDLAAAIIEIIARDSCAYGTYHFSNEGKTSWFEFARAIYAMGRERGRIGRECVVKPISTDQYPAKVKRPHYSVLSKEKITSVFSRAIPSWEDDSGISLMSLVGGEMSQTRNFRNFLVTGGCGFIGINFIRFLFSRPGFTGRVINLDKLTYAGNPASLADIAAEKGSRYVLEQQDICNADAVKSVFSRYEVDAVVHFAAESHVDRSILGPREFVETNVLGTFTLLETARAAWKDRKDVVFHHVSTDEVFGSLGPTGFFSEDTPYAPRSPYSASKAGSDHLVRAYHHTYGLPVTMSNCSNNYGPYQFPEKLIPLMILNMLDGKTLPVYGDGKAIRDWLYVEDHASAIWTIMKRSPLGETYNVGGETERRAIDNVNTLCEIVAGETGKPVSTYTSLIRFVADRPGHDQRYAIDCSKIKRDLGWTQLFRYDQGLRSTVRWYMDNTAWVENVRSGDYRKWIDLNYTAQNRA